MLSHRAAVQRDLDRAEPTEAPVNYSRNAVQHLWRNNPLQEYSLEIDWLESSFSKEDVGSCGQQVGHEPAVCLVTKTNKYILGCTGSSIVSRLREKTALPHSVLIGPNPEHCVQFCTGQNRTWTIWRGFSRTTPQSHGAGALVLWGGHWRVSVRLFRGMHSVKMKDNRYKSKWAV